MDINRWVGTYRNLDEWKADWNIWVSGDLFDEVVPDDDPSSLAIVLYGPSGIRKLAATDFSHLGRKRIDYREVEFDYGFLGSWDFEWCNFSNADLTEADCNHANFRHANLRGANLTGTKLNYADLSNAYLVDATLKNANLTGAILTGATLPNGKIWTPDTDMSEFTD